MGPEASRAGTLAGPSSRRGRKDMGKLTKNVLAALIGIALAWVVGKVAGLW